MYKEMKGEISDAKRKRGESTGPGRVRIDHHLGGYDRDVGADFVGTTDSQRIQ